MPVKCRSPKRSEAQINLTAKTTTRRSTLIMVRLRKCRQPKCNTQNCRYNTHPQSCQRPATRDIFNLHDQKNTRMIRSIPTISYSLTIEPINFRTRFVPLSKYLSATQLIAFIRVFSFEKSYHCIEAACLALRRRP